MLVPALIDFLMSLISIIAPQRGIREHLPRSLAAARSWLGLTE
jgi:hypothetical protein